MTTVIYRKSRRPVRSEELVVYERQPRLAHTPPTGDPGRNKAKARSHAQKRAVKRGRPRHQVAFREPNGRASRAEDPIDRLALQVRARMLGISEARARDQRSGSFLGYLAMLGHPDGLSSCQYEAALTFRELRNDYLKAIKAPNAVLDNQSTGNSGDAISDNYIHWCEKVKEHYTAARKAVQTAQNETRTNNLWAALDLVVIQEQPIFNLIGATRQLCNALIQHFRL